MTTALDDGSGTIRPELLPLFNALRAMNRARSGVLWLSRPHVPPILRALARGDVPLTHAGLNTLTPWRSVMHVRDLLIQTGVLPPADRFLLRVEQWLPDWLTSINDTEHRALLEQFANWHVLRTLRQVTEKEPIGPYRANAAHAQLHEAAAFLQHLADHGRRLAETTQADLDRWFATATTTRRRELVRNFLSWCIKRRELPRLHLPQTEQRNTAPISQKQHLALIKRVLIDETIPQCDRVVALLTLIYAQPLARIGALTIDDVLHDEDQVLLRLADPPTPVPEPFATVLTDYLADRSNLHTATNPGSRLLFPGRRAGQPMHTTSLRLRNLGLPNRDGRTAAFRQLVLQAPAPVVAGMLGYKPATAETRAAEAGETWKRYAPGDHAKR